MAYLLPYLCYPTSFAHIVYRLVSTLLLTVCLFIPCVTLCRCMCRTALLYRGQVTVANENLFSTSLPG